MHSPSNFPDGECAESQHSPSDDAKRTHWEDMWSEDDPAKMGELAGLNSPLVQGECSGQLSPTAKKNPDDSRFEETCKLLAAEHALNMCCHIGSKQEYDQIELQLFRMALAFKNKFVPEV
jgi:hypothetical protein